MIAMEELDERFERGAEIGPRHQSLLGPGGENWMSRFDPS